MSDDTITPLTQEDGQSKDLVKENVEKLKKLFPEIVTDGKIDFETLREELGEFRETSDERYSFTWNGKSKARKLAMEPSRGTLRPAPEESMNWDETDHLFIEGDNLEVLKLLQRGYHKKIKLIYIDPPYNTGEDFIYSDNYQDNLKNYLESSGQLNEEGNKISSNPEYSGRYHTDWLNMMYPRLKLCKELLKEDGIIFISIDDHENENLIKMCNEIFGEENFVSELIWKSGRTASAHFTNEHEYILCFAKNKDELPLFSYKGDKTISDRAIKKPSAKNPMSRIEFPAGIDFESEDKVYPDELGDSEPIKVVEGKLEAKNGKLANDVVLEAAWSMKDMINDWLDGKEVIDQKGQVVKRFYFKNNGALQYEKQKGTIHPKSVITGITTKKGSKEVEDLLGQNYFDFPKPSKLIYDLLSVVLEEDSEEIVLDFFAGSSTTAHALLKLNKKRNANHKFMMVQLPEIIEEDSDAFKADYSTIAELSKERIRRVISRMEEQNPQFEGDLGFKVFKLDSSNIKPWDPSFDKVQLSIEDSIENVKPNRSEKDLLYEILLKYGIDLSLPIEERKIDGAKVFVGGAGALVLCPSDNITLDVVEGIAKIKDEYEPEIMRVVFRDNGFKDDVVKTNAIQILKQHGIEDVKSI